MADAGRPADELPALSPSSRMGWGVALALFAQIFITAALVVLIPLTHAPRALLPAVLFFVTRIIGDLARAFAGNTPTGMAIEGHAKSLAWILLVEGSGMWMLDQREPFGSTWITGLALALAGASLWGHHVHAERVAARLGKEEGILGAVMATIGTPLAVTGVPLPAPWDIIAPLATFAVIAALSTRAIMRLARRKRGPSPHASGGWGAWYQDHFFRLTLLLVATLAYLFVRTSLVGIVPYLFLFEYAAAVFALGLVLWTLRNHLSKRLDEHPLASPHRRHEQQVERQGETGFDAVESAFGAFLTDGRTEGIQRLATDLEQRGIPAGHALAPVTTYHREERTLLIHPGWLYAVRLVAVLLVAIAVRMFVSQVEPADPNAPSVAFLATLAAGVYAAQWNRFGGPWWIKTGLGASGVALLLLVDARIQNATSGEAGAIGALLSTPIGLLLFVAILALPALHPWRAKKGKPIPRYGYAGNEPIAAIGRLRQNAEGALVRRTLWSLGLGVAVFIIAGELSRFAPQLFVLFPLYLIVALLAVLQPLGVTAGLRLGANQVHRRHQREQQHRQRIFDDAISRLEHTFSEDTPRAGRAQPPAGTRPR